MTTNAGPKGLPPEDVAELIHEFDDVVRAARELQERVTKAIVEQADVTTIASLMIRAREATTPTEKVYETLKNRIQFLSALQGIQEVEVVYEGWPYAGAYKTRPTFRMVAGLGADLEMRQAAIDGGFAVEGEDMFFQIAKFTKDNVGMLPPDWTPRGVVLKEEQDA